MSLEFYICCIFEVAEFCMSQHGAYQSFELEVYHTGIKTQIRYGVPYGEFTLLMHAMQLLLSLKHEIMCVRRPFITANNILLASFLSTQLIYDIN